MEADALPPTKDCDWRHKRQLLACFHERHNHPAAPLPLPPGPGAAAVCDRCCVVTVGPPGCGKSTLARALDAGRCCIGLSFDEYKAAHPFSSAPWPAFLDALQRLAAIALAVGTDVVVDSCNVTRAQRCQVALALRCGNPTIRIVVIDFGKSVLSGDHDTVVELLLGRIAQRDSHAAPAAEAINQKAPGERERLLRDRFLRTFELPQTCAEPFIDEVVHVDLHSDTGSQCRQCLAQIGRDLVGNATFGDPLFGCLNRAGRIDGRSGRECDGRVQNLDASTLTIAVIKPDGVANNHQQAILREARQAGFTVLRTREVHGDRAWARVHAEAENAHQGWCGAYVNYLASGTSAAVALGRAQGAITTWRQMLGPPNVELAKQHAPLSLRARFGESDGRGVNAGKKTR